jgi:hypothetical protein
MASANSTFTELVTTTLRSHPGEITDAVSGHNGLASVLKSKGKIKKVSGGYKIVRPLDYAENSTYQRYSGYDQLNIQASEVLSAAEFDWMQAAINVTASGRELRLNNGREQIIDLAEARLNNAKRTAANNFSIDLYSSGALSNQMGGLASIIQTDGLGTVGGISATTYSMWANQKKELTGTDAWTKSTIRGYMQALWLDCVRGPDKPDLLVSTNDFYSAYWESLSDLQRYTDVKSANSGFQELAFNSAKIIHDSNSNFSATGERMYFLNTDFLDICVHPEANWTVSEEREAVNQDAVVIPLLWMGNLVCSNRARQGIMIDAS